MGREAGSRPGRDVVWDSSVPPTVPSSGLYGWSGEKPPPAPAARLPPPRNQLAEGRSWDRRQLEIDRGRDTKKGERTGQGEGSLCKWSTDSRPLMREGARGGGSQASPGKADRGFSAPRRGTQKPGPRIPVEKDGYRAVSPPV